MAFELIELTMFGDKLNYSLENLWKDYKIEFLDYFSTCLPYLLDGLTPEVAKTNRKCDRALING